MTVDRAASVERVLVEIRPAAATYWNFLDLSGSTQLLAMFQRAPWRSILIGVAGGILSSALHSDWMLGVVLILAVMLGALELMHRRDLLTTRRLVRQYGLLGRRRLELDLVQILRVGYSYPRFGKFFGAGDVDVVGVGRAFTFVGVRNPEGLARAILDAKAALADAKGSGDAGAGPVGSRRAWE